MPAHCEQQQVCKWPLHCTLANHHEVSPVKLAGPDSRLLPHHSQLDALRKSNDQLALQKAGLQDEVASVRQELQEKNLQVGCSSSRRT